MARLLLLLALSLAAVACVGSDPSPSAVSPSTAGTSTTTATTSGTSPTTSADKAATTQAPTTLPLDELELGLREVASGFTQPVVVRAPVGDERLFVVDQPGIVWVIDGGDPEVFIDITDDVVFQGERGLLGMTFAPGSSRVFYLAFTDEAGATTITEFQVGDDPNRADVETARAVISIAQPAANHNGGMIAFGPDGLLWIGTGDGGGGNDQFGNGQRPDTLLGALLRIDPDTSSLDEPDRYTYAVPEDNPYVDGGVTGDLDGAVEVWAIGLRNPWRFDFDGADLWIADVGQNAIEEINRVDTAPGLPRNFGWPILEGTRCVQASGCDDVDLIAPVHEYDHSQGCSVTGGSVYRGTEIPELDGHYLFGDYCAGWVRSIEVDDAGTTFSFHQWFDAGAVANLASFGVGGDGEVYVVSAGGSVFKIVRLGS